MKNILLFLTLILSISFFNCNNEMAGAADNNVQFYSKGYHIPFEVKISVTGNNMELFYKSSEMKDAFSQNFSISDEEKDEIFGYLNEIDFMKMEVPDLVKKMDAPVAKLTAKLNGESREIDIGQLPSIPQSLVTLRTKMFNLASAYKPEWKKEVGF